MKSLTNVLSLALALSTQASAWAIPSSYASRALSLVPRLDINEILALITELFPVDVTLEDAQGLIEAGDEALALALGYSTTYNDLTDGECADVTLIFARGTDEPGNVGALVGPEFYSALQSALGSTTSIFQGVNDYDASVTQYLEGGSTTAASDMATLVTQAFTQCPDTQVVMSGYSQGAQVVHLAASDLAAATMEKVSAVVTFGDPDSDTAVANIDSSKVLIICHEGDDICDFGDLILLPHLTYAENATAAAAFVVEQL
ncbi:family 5 carbohydrate esterase [Cryphonectria parasitica EP155]|uniref:Cutinase n=1 Tax=Cryphonectria parasitica (strain ATCC 38755 / EP155) TaxID=660469 RepID=A0A9P5CMC3_CRYP1|nr:family 5 carbohydrate esterase [Cryphonectria parasitica EP155]KAF3763112.1 family 5 carbohydrate esterase [Cryphonectria parasitica EP155]